MTFLSLFAGIGGVDLGLERSGMRCIGQVEINEFCRKVLAKHWPNVWRHDDVKTFCRRIGDNEPETDDGVTCSIHGIEFGDCPCIGTDEFTDTCGFPDVICGGFPCQPHSRNGNQGGASDERDMWPEFRRIVEQLHPAWIVAENVPGLADTILDGVIADLEAQGYEVQPILFSAGSIGASHRRERLFILASDLTGVRVERVRAERVEVPRALDFPLLPIRSGDGQWEVEPDVCRTTHGVSGRVDRLRSLGNAVVPQVAELIGRAIMEAA